MVYHVDFNPAAVRQLRKLPREAQERVRDAIDGLAEIPRPDGVAKMKGSRVPHYRIRVGNYRVIYQVDDDRVTVLVVKVADRKEAYLK